MADCRMVPPPRVTSLQTQASLRASALRSSLVPPLPTPSICSTSGPSITSTIFPSRRRRLARPCASVDLPAPLIPVNQTVKPFDELPRFIAVRSKRLAHHTFAPNECLFDYSDNFFFCKIAAGTIPGIDAGALHAPGAHRNDQISHAGPEWLLPIA